MRILFIVNICLIPVFKENGAVIGTLIAEILGLIFQFIYAKDIFLLIKISKKNLWQYFLGGGLIGLYLIFIKHYTSLNSNLLLVFGTLGSIIIYGGTLFLFKNPFIIPLKKRAKE